MSFIYSSTSVLLIKGPSTLTCLLLNKVLEIKWVEFIYYVSIH